MNTAPCPRCQCTHAAPVTFTWWGGLLGPKILHVVRCGQCATQYNSATGRLNTTAIAIWVVAGCVLGGAIGWWFATM